MWWSACRGCVAAVFIVCVVSPTFAQVAYEYDPLGRLTKVTHEGGTITEYEYDAADNRVDVVTVLASVPAFSIDDVAIFEGGVLSFTVTKTGSTALTHAVSYATANGTAGSGDYTATSGMLTFTSGQTTKTVTVTTTEDSAYETNETVLVNLSSPTNGATISDAQGVGTINDDDGAPSFSVNNVSVSEGGNLVFTVTKSGATSQSHVVSYATANGTASSGDYTAASGSLTFTSGQTTKTVTVTTTEDATYEVAETVLLNLSGATNGATISDSQGAGAINNDDAGPSFSVNNVSVTEGGNLVFTVTKSGATSQSHAVSYATANGTASSGDYTAASGSRTFTSGQTTKTVTVSTTQDSTYESNETVLLNLSGATNGASISDAQGIGTINNDDAANQAPTANNDTAAGCCDATLGINVLANDTDPDGDPLTVTNLSAPTNGGIVYIGLGGSVNFNVPFNPGPSSIVTTFTYMISDGNGGTDTAIVYVTVGSDDGGGE